MIKSLHRSCGKTLRIYLPHGIKITIFMHGVIIIIIIYIYYSALTSKDIQKSLYNK